MTLDEVVATLRQCDGLGDLGTFAPKTLYLRNTRWYVPRTTPPGSSRTNADHRLAQRLHHLDAISQAVVTERGITFALTACATQESLRRLCDRPGLPVAGGDVVGKVAAQDQHSVSHRLLPEVTTGALGGGVTEEQMSLPTGAWVVPGLRAACINDALGRLRCAAVGAVIGGEGAVAHGVMAIDAEGADVMLGSDVGGHLVASDKTPQVSVGGQCMPCAVVGRGVGVAELVGNVGVDAVRYAVLRVPRGKPVVVEQQELVRDATVGALRSVQLAHARLVRLAPERLDGWSLGRCPVVADGLVDGRCPELVGGAAVVAALVLELPYVIQRAVLGGLPHVVLAHLEKLAKAVHRWYVSQFGAGSQVAVAGHEVGDVALVAAAACVALRRALFALGLSAPLRV